MKNQKKITKKELKRLERLEVKRKFKEWGEEVKNRDGRMCVLCGATRYINAHHIIPRENKEFRFDLDNGISLCAKHHKFSFEISPHKNPLLFFIWMELNRKEQLKILKCKLKDYLKNSYGTV